MPSLCADSVVVLAGRQPPAAEWRVDPGWRTLVAEHRLDLLDQTESAELLLRSGVNAAAVAHLVNVGDVHPLTLGLLASAARRRVPEGLKDAPDIVSSVLPIILADVPDEHHALGLDLCAMAWLLTKHLRAEAVGPRTDEVWTWLADQPFISQSPDGLSAHDLVRDVLEAHQSLVRPDQHQRLFSLTRLHARRDVARTSGQQRLRAATQLCWLHRRGTLVGAAIGKLVHEASVRVAVARAHEPAEVLDLVERVDGPDEAAAIGVIIEWLTQSFAWAWNVTKEPELFAPSFEYMGVDQRVDIDDGSVAFGIDW